MSTDGPTAAPRPSRGRRTPARAWGAVALLLALTGCTVAAADVETPPAVAPAPTAAAGPTPDVGPTPVASPTADPLPEAAGTSPGSALAAVDLLEVKGRAPMTGYDRDLFAYRSVDLDRNGCDTRNDVLRRDLRDVVLRPGSDGCVVESGTLDDPYSGRTLAFVRGTGTSSAVQIDHVVALADAWQKGAQQWDEPTRHAFGNDPLNLLAVDGPLNQQKGAGDTATWLPPNTAFRCTYVARQVAVKVTYGLWVTAAERDAMVRVLSGCPQEPLPGVVAGAVEDATPEGAPAPAPPAAEPAPPAAEVPADVHYASCAAVRAAGAAPLLVGSPGYRAGLDRDGDGVACE